MSSAAGWLVDMVVICYLDVARTCGLQLATEELPFRGFREVSRWVAVLSV